MVDILATNGAAGKATFKAGSRNYVARPQMVHPGYLASNQAQAVDARVLRVQLPVPAYLDSVLSKAECDAILTVKPAATGDMPEPAAKALAAQQACWLDSTDASVLYVQLDSSAAALAKGKRLQHTRMTTTMAYREKRGAVALAEPTYGSVRTLSPVLDFQRTPPHPTVAYLACAALMRCCSLPWFPRRQAAAAVHHRLRRQAPPVLQQGRRGVPDCDDNHSAHRQGRGAHLAHDRPRGVPQGRCNIVSCVGQHQQVGVRQRFLLL